MSLRDMLEATNNRVNELEVQSLSFAEEREKFDQFKQELLRKYQQVRQLKEYLVSNQTDKLASVLADPNRFERCAKLGTLERNCDKLEEYYLQCIQDVKEARLEISEFMN